MRNHGLKKLARSYFIAAGLLLFAALLLGACGQEETSQDGQKLTEVKMVLDWTPNTNHTGLYVARDLGYFEQEGLKVDIIQPGAGGANEMVATGTAQFGVGYQEEITHARVQGVPLVSIAAIIQHNTSGFASPKRLGIQSPKDLEGKTYAGYGSPTEEALISSIMRAAGADPSKVKMISTGSGDFFTSTASGIDFALIYYAWTGVEAELRGEPIDILYLNEYSEKLDFYTPILITNEQMIAEKPEVARAFMKAVSKGYKYAIEKPAEAADILLKAVPDLNKELVIASQEWLSTRYQDDAPRWGEQKRTVWANYADWMLEHKLLDGPLDVDAAFTNEFLP